MRSSEYGSFLNQRYIEARRQEVKQQAINTKTVLTEISGKKEPSELFELVEEMHSRLEQKDLLKRGESLDPAGELALNNSINTAVKVFGQNIGEVSRAFTETQKQKKKSA